MQHSLKGLKKNFLILFSYLIILNVRLVDKIVEMIKKTSAENKIWNSFWITFPTFLFSLIRHFFFFTNESSFYPNKFWFVDWLNLFVWGEALLNCLLSVKKSFFCLIKMVCGMINTTI